jgi:hypothetical protein
MTRAVAVATVMLAGCGTVDNDQWHHAVQLVDRVTGDMVLYFDGVEVRSTSVPRLGKRRRTVPGRRRLAARRAAAGPGVRWRAR